MPDQTGKLTDAERAEISQRINQRWEGRDDKCPICGDTQWQVAPHIVTPIILGLGNNVQLGGPAYPQAMLISPCGHTRYVNILMLGLGGMMMPSPPAATQTAPTTAPEEKK